MPRAFRLLCLLLLALLASEAAAAQDALRPRTVVIDPGHGGRHRGGLGTVNGRRVTEAELTLPIAFELERLMAADPLLTPIVTRRTDVYIGLRDRTRIAEQANGELFLSIHYNAVPTGGKTSVRGAELWVWSPRESDDVAAKYLMQLDNEDDDPLGGSNTKGRTVLSKMLLDALEEQALRSKTFATSLERTFKRDSHFAGNWRGIKSSRMKVLENYNMPSVLVEVAFVSNPTDAKLATERAFQQRVARHLYNGVVDYFNATDPDFRAARSRQVASRK